MKKIVLLMATLFCACMISVSLAYEASVIDTNNDVIVRVYTKQNATLTYDAYLEVRDFPDAALTPNNIVTVKNNGSEITPPEQDGSYKILSALDSEFFSIFYDDVSHLTYLLLINSSSLQTNKIEINVNRTTNGVCGSASGGSYASAPSSGLCSSGNPTTVTSSGNYWLWSCEGINGGQNAACTANRIINGVCGSANGQTFASPPTSNLCSAGNASSVTGNGPWYWTCYGINGGSNDSCSAQKTQSTQVDLIVSSIKAPSIINNNSPFNLTITVSNQGSENAGAFTVKIYANTSQTPGGTLIDTWNLSGLAAGTSIQRAVTLTLSHMVVHYTYYFVGQADSQGVIAETNENNNTYSRYFTVGN